MPHEIVNEEGRGVFDEGFARQEPTSDGLRPSKDVRERQSDVVVHRRHASSTEMFG